MRAATGASVAAVARIDQTIGEISAIAGSIAAAVKQQDAATAEIARNVAETADAANEMTSRTSEVSTEAVGTGRHAVDLRDNTVALNQAVEELRHSVIEVVRTSTAEVDRRQIQALCGGSGGPAYRRRRRRAGRQVSDLSEGGACCAARRSAGRARGTLRIDGVAAPLPCVVRAVDDDRLHLAFAQTAAAARVAAVLSN